jgi:hypothetical protein
MKTLNIKTLIIGALLVTMGTAGWSKEGGPRNRSKNFPEEQAAFYNDLERAKLHRGEIRCLKAEMKADKQAKRKMDVAIDKKEIKESKAKLRNSKDRLRVDRQDLKVSYRLATEAKRERVCLLDKAVRAAEKDLKNSMKYGNQATINRDAAYLTYINQAYLDAENSLAEFKVERKQDMAVIDEDVRDFRPQIANIVRSHNQDDYAGNCVLK